MSSSVFAIPSAEERCNELADVDIWNFALSLFIVVGILVSYLPQHLRIILRGSSEGLSPWFVLLGTVSGTSAIFNIFLLPTSTVDIQCCSVNSPFSCAAGLLGIAQVSVQWLCFFAVMLLFLIYFPKETTEGTDESLEEGASRPRYRDALTVAAISFLHFFVLIVLSVVFYALHLLGPWANFLGIMSALLACVQYFPQIYTTYKLGEVKSLSVPMMCIQTPGSYVFATSLYLRLGWPGWSAWGVYVITGALQGVLLAMGLQFIIRDWKVNKALDEETRRNTFYNGRRNSDGYDDDQPSEQTPLLGEPQNGDSSNGHATDDDLTKSRLGHDTIRKSKLSIVHNADE